MTHKVVFPLPSPLPPPPDGKVGFDAGMPWSSTPGSGFDSTNAWELTSGLKEMMQEGDGEPDTLMGL